MKFPLHLSNYLIEGKSFTLFEPDSAAVSSSYQRGKIGFPYWSQVWPAAIGMAMFILKNQQFIANKKVLELAAGLGLPSLVAATTGAASVIASDYVLEAVSAIQQTATHHQLKNMLAQLIDWTALPTDLSADILLLSDVSYDERLFATQENVIHRFLKMGTTVIIATPQRLVAKQAIESLLSFCKYQEEIAVTHQQKTIAISLFILQ